MYLFVYLACIYDNTKLLL